MGHSTVMSTASDLPPTPSPPSVVPPLPPPLSTVASPEKFRIALYRDRFDTRPTSIEVAWESLVDFLIHHVEESPCTVEEGPKRCKGRECPYKSHSIQPDNYMAWSPVEIAGNRLDKNVRAVTLLVLDFDHLSSETVTLVRQRLAPYEHVLHTTHNHLRDGVGDACLRAVLRTSRPVHTDQFHRFLRAAVARFDVPADPTCKNRSRFYYSPSHPKGAVHFAERVRGQVLDVDEVLAWSEVSLPAAPVPSYEDDHLLPETAEWDLDGEDVQAAIDIMARYFPPKRRNDLCLAISGMLRRAGATLDDARYIVEEICVQGGSENPSARAKTVDHTYTLSDDGWMTGLTRAVEILSEYLNEAEAQTITKDFGDRLILARNEAFLRDFMPSMPVSGSNGHGAVVSVPPVNLGALRRLVSGLASEKARSLERDDRIGAVLLRRVVAGQTLAQPGGYGDVETVLEGESKGVGREKAILKVVGMLAWAFPRGTLWEAVAELVRLSVSVMGSEWMERAERAFRLAQGSREVKEREQEAQQAALQERARQDAIAASAAVAERPGLFPAVPSGASGAAGAGGDPPDGRDWRDKMHKRGDGAFTQTPDNVRLLLNNHEDFLNCFRWNEVTKKVDVVAGPMLKYRHLNIEGLTAGLQDYIEAAHGIVIGDKVIMRRLVDIARSNPYDPLKDYLNSLIWDGVPRISCWLKTYCGASKQSDEYLEKVGRKWMIALVARGLSPGCKVDNVLVLEAPPGTGKSTVFSILGAEFYCDTAIQLGDKDSRMMAGHYWICELAEIVAFKRTGHDLLKGFISSQVDKFRPPFERSYEESPRRCVWVGTTNDDTYFGDETGNRKYWPVSCAYTSGALEALRHDRSQLLAEAVAAFRAGESWYFGYEEISLTEEETEQRMVETPAKLKVESWWYGMSRAERPRSGLTTLDVFEMAFETTADRAKPGDLKAIGHALAKMKFLKKRDSYAPRHWRHFATEELLNAEHRPPPRRGSGPGLFVIPGGKKDEKVPPIPPLPPEAKK